jgi:hypothetical protein
MLYLSRSFTHAHVHAVSALVNGQCFQPALVHPGDAEAADAIATYRSWLWGQLQRPHTSTYKHLVRLAQVHQRGGTVIIRVHQNAQHGDLILAAIRWLAAKLPAPVQVQSSHNGSAHFLPGLEAYEPDERIEPERLVWVSGHAVTHLAYLWDTEGVYTALVPGHGLVKLGRLGPWQRLRHARILSPRVRFARLELTEQIEQTFLPLIERQQTFETVDIIRRQLPYSGHGLAGATLPYEPRYDAWDVAPLAEDEPLPTPEEQQHELAVRQLLAPPSNGFAFHQLLPTKYRGEHVKPVFKTKADGTRWVLTPEMQARGALHLYQQIQ